METPNPLNPLGVKGAGEGGTIPAPAAIVSAIEDALSPFGVRFTEAPLTPDRIVDALRKAGAYEQLAARVTDRSGIASPRLDYIEVRRPLRSNVACASRRVKSRPTEPKCPWPSVNLKATLHH